MMGDRLQLLLSPPTRLGIGDSVGALLSVADRGYLLQKRDIKPGIFFPGFLSLFGGALDRDEDPASGLRRELNEELGLDISYLKPFGGVAFDWTQGGIAGANRWYFEAQLPEEALNRIVLGEGANHLLLSARECFSGASSSPLNAFALWCHHCRDDLDNANI